jgi:anti-sigma B factor antagonist
LWLNLFALNEVLKMSDKSVEFSLDITRSGNTATIRCHGKLVAGQDNILYHDVKQLLPDYKCIVLDLTDLTRMDSMGLGALVRLYVSARSAGCSLELINLSKQVRMLLKTANLLSAFSTVCEYNIKMG